MIIEAIPVKCLLTNLGPEIIFERQNIQLMCNVTVVSWLFDIREEILTFIVGK